MVKRIAALSAVLVAVPAGVVLGTAGVANAAGGFPAVAFHAAGDDLWTLTNGNGKTYGAQVADGTSPAITTTQSGYDIQVAFQNRSGILQMVGSTTGYGGQAMASGTSPSITEIQPPSTPEGQYIRSGWQAAFQNAAGNLQTVGFLRPREFSLGMAPGTSPAIASLANGNDGLPHWQVAMQANTGNLITVGDFSLPQDTGFGMAAGTSPAIARLPQGGYVIAFQANNGRLYTTGSQGARDWGVGMRPGTSPSIATVNALGSIQIAFQSDAGDLWTVGAAGTRNWQLQMDPRSSPSIGQVPGVGLELAFTSAGGELWTVGDIGNQNWSLGVAPGTSPSIITGN